MKNPEFLNLYTNASDRFQTTVKLVVLRQTAVDNKVNTLPIKQNNSIN